MPMPSVEPMPFPPLLDRLLVPDDAQDASYLAASARISSLSRMDRMDICSIYVHYRSSASFLWTKTPLLKSVAVLKRPAGNDLRLNFRSTLKNVQDAGIAQDAADLIFQRIAVAAMDL